MSHKDEEIRGLNRITRRPSGLRVALYRPEVPPNVGAVLRLAACIGLGVDLIEPFGFVYHPAKLRRIALDYGDKAAIRRHASFEAFDLRRRHAGRRLVLLTTSGARAHTDLAFRPEDVLMAGRESAGVPEAVHAAADARVTVPMLPGLRSLNVVTALAMVVGEALRQTDA